MGTALRFNEEARAAFMALVLRSVGHGVLWEREAPMMVMTSAGKSEVRELSEKHKGAVIEEWWKLPDINCGRRTADEI